MQKLRMIDGSVRPGGGVKTGLTPTSSRAMANLARR
jgi:hypothetical protein